MTIGWYVHHHGAGHRQRFLAVRPYLHGLTALSSLPRPAGLAAEEWIELPLDAPAEGSADPEAGGVLHWAPRHHAGLRLRMAGLAAWIERARPSALVVDVSVEIALYARLMGVPVIWIGQRGRRLDRPHRAAYQAADVIVPWTRAVAGQTPGLPRSTRYCGAFSRLDGRVVTSPPGRRRVLLLVGEGGAAISDEDIDAARRASPGWSWRRPERAASNAALWSLLMDSDVVVGSAGTNVVAEVAAARRPFVCLPQPRPFAEQHDQARALAIAGLAESLPRWPTPLLWPAVLGRSGTRDPARWSVLHDGQGAQRAATYITEVACGSR